MEKVLLEFINTLELSLKKVQTDASGFSRLTISQLQYIDAIGTLGKPAVSEVASQLNITKASVTAAINKLIALGYVVKTQSEDDKRVFHVTLTDAGQELVGVKRQALKAYMEFIGSALSEDETRQFEAILTKLVALFNE